MNGLQNAKVGKVLDEVLLDVVTDKLFSLERLPPLMIDIFLSDIPKELTCVGRSLMTNDDMLVTMS